MRRTRLFIDLPEALARATRIEATRRGIPISHLAAEALEQALGLAHDEAERRRQAAARTLEIARRNARAPARTRVRTDELVLHERERPSR